MWSRGWSLLTIAGCLCVWAEKLPTRTYTTADGLGHNHINRIKVDSHGFLWICTDNGVSRFDGQRFFTLTMDDGLPHPDVNDIVEDRQGVFWMATDGGVARFRLRSPGTNERPAIQTFRPASNSAEHFDAVEIDLTGRLWAGGKAGLYLVEQVDASVVVRPQETRPQADVVRLLAARDGGLWVATGYGTSYRKRDGGFILFESPRFGERALAQALLEDREGRIWVGYRTGGGWCRYAGATADLVREDFCAMGPELWDVRTAEETSDGRLWLGTSGGLCEFHRASRRVECFGPGTGVSDDRVLKSALDREGNLWLGTGATGLIRVLRPGFALYSAPEGYSTSYAPWLAESHAGRVLVGLGHVLPKGDALLQEVRRARLAPVWWARRDPDGGQVNSGRQGAMEDSQGRWFVFSGQSLYEFSAGTAVEQLATAVPRRTKLPPYVSFLRVFQDRHGGVWASARSQRPEVRPGAGFVMARSSSGEFQGVPVLNAGVERLQQQRKAVAWVSAFADDGRGGLWLGLSTTHLLFPSRAMLLLRYRDGKLAEYSQADGVPGGNINAMHVDQRGRLWLATQAGLARADNQHDERPRFARYGTREGLSSEEVWSVTEDLAGQIYVGTAKGVDRLQVETGRIRHYGADDGLAPGSVLAAMRGRDGTLWFATETALARFEPEKEVASAAATFVASPATTMRLPYDRSFFEAQFTSPSFSGGPVRFQYRLAGQDWGPAVSESTIRYAGMRPGDYELQARALTAAGVASAQVASLRFTVLPPFWLTSWFLSLSLVSALALLYALHRYRVNQLLAVESVRTRIASDLHDDIGSTLSQVSLLGELARRSLNGQHPAASDLIDRMSAASREAVAAMSDLVWSIHPSHDRASDLAQRMRSFASDVLGARDIDFDFRWSAGHAPAAIPPEVRRDLLLVFKETVHNVVRHAACQRVRAALSLDGREAVLTVEDDGAGIAAPGPGGNGNGHGLVNMRARAEKAGGSLTVEPQAGSRGTRVTCRLPLAPRRRALQ